MQLDVWQEYDWAAEWLAQRPEGTPLPRRAISDTAQREIDNDPDAFAERVRQHRYALAMEKLGLPDA